MGHVSRILYSVMRHLIITQGVCIFLIFAGLVVETILLADMGYFLITLGSVIFAITTKIESYLTKKGKD